MLAPERPLHTAPFYSPPKRKSADTRLISIDAVRGLAMVLMALDHVRYFFPIRGVVLDPTDLNRTTIPLFLTRWVTHFCAPAFVFLAGVAVSLSLSGPKNKNDVRHFLIKRGFWLILLEFTVVHFGFSFELPFQHVVAQVMWALGVSFLVLAGLLSLPSRTVGLLGLFALVVQPWALQTIRDLPLPLPAVTSALFAHEAIPFSPGFTVTIKYPLAPWVGLALVGYALGPLYLKSSFDRKKRLLSWGAATVGAFIALRFFDLSLYAPWRSIMDPGTLFLWFINCEKYPPSFLFVLMTMGPVFLLLAWFERPSSRLARPLCVFGKTPLFYYLLHIPLAHAMFLACDFVRERPPVSTFFPPDEWGYALPLIFVLWILLVLILYPACAWYRDAKARNKGAWWAKYI